MIHKKIVGIIGGMGPTCSANFFQEFIFQLNSLGIQQDSDFPEIILISLPLPPTHWNETGFIFKDKINNQPILDKMQECLDKLYVAGAELIVIPCNTIHYLIDEFKQMSKVPIISIVDSVSTHIKEMEYERVGIFCSESTTKLNIYKDLNPVLSTDTEQELSTRMISSVMFGKHTETEKNEFRVAVENKYKNDNLDAVILGCTELPLLLNQNETFVPLIDTTKILAEKLASEIIK